MSKQTLWPSLFFLIFIITACQLDPRNPVAYFVPQTPTATWTATPTATATVTPSPSATPTQTASPTAPALSTPLPISATASSNQPNQPHPTATPRPGEPFRLAFQMYRNGNYSLAWQQFEALFADPAADSFTQAQALHWRGRAEQEMEDYGSAIATFKLFLSQYLDHPLMRSTQFNLGLSYEQQGSYSEALLAYQLAIVPDDLINAYIYERMGDVALQTGSDQMALEFYQAGVVATDEVRFQVHLREGVAGAYLALAKPEEAIAQYEAILNVATIGSYRAKILRLLAEAYLMAKDEEKAWERYQEAIDNYPTAPDSHLALQALVNAAVPVDDFQRGLVNYHAQAYQPAIAAFDRYLEATANAPNDGASPDSAAVADALWYKGLSWLALGQYNSGILTLQQLIDRHPSHPQWGQAHIEIGKARIDQDNIAQAKSVFREFAAKNAADPLAPEALWRAGRLELDGDLLGAAYTSLRALARAYPVSDYATDALYWAGQAAYLQGDLTAAIDSWDTLLKNYPRSNLASFGGYWQARALQEQGDTAKAEQILRQTATRTDEYYGLRSQDLLSGVPPHSVPLTSPTPEQLLQAQLEAEAWLATWLGSSATEVATATSVAAFPATLENSQAFQRGRLLIDLGLREEAAAEFEDAQEIFQDDPLALYHLSKYLSEQDFNRLSIVTAGRLIFLSPAGRVAEAPLFIQQLMYPFPYPDVIFAEAADQGIDPALILSIIRQESLFEPEAESHVGAMGLMQVMPTTGDYIAERGNFSDFDRDHLWLPYISIKFGAWYIEQQLAIFDGNQFAALAAYNAGPGNVLEWIKVSDDLDVFVEAIPFRESRSYIRRIYVNLAQYRRIYGLGGEGD